MYDDDCGYDYEENDGDDLKTLSDNEAWEDAQADMRDDCDYHCRTCGCGISAAEGDDNGGECEDCASDESECDESECECGENCEVCNACGECLCECTCPDDCDETDEDLNETPMGLELGGYNDGDD